MTTKSFDELGVSAEVVEALAGRGIEQAFPIQEAVIETALAGNDLCGKAPTGSGKTLAFGIPVVDLAAKGKAWRPKALVLSPTRELATQIKDELEPLAKARRRSIATVFGGTNIERDIRRLEQGVDILVACPGRLEDLIARRCCELRNVDLVVIDEADRMADMGFLPAVKRILDQTPDDRHTMLFSATLDGDIDVLRKRYQRDPVVFEVETDVEADAGTVEHLWFEVGTHNRIDSAVEVLRTAYSSIVFCRTRRGCDRVTQLINKRGLRAVAIHGDRSQGQRERALREFAKGEASVLVATDVAARGIHVDDVELVLHYDPAGSDKDYVHRSGRTGRAGRDGRVISLVTDNKRSIALALQKDLGVPQHLPPFEEAELPEPRAEYSEGRAPKPHTPDRDDRKGAKHGGKGAKHGGKGSGKGSGKGKSAKHGDSKHYGKKKGGKGRKPDDTRGRSDERSDRKPKPSRSKKSGGDSRRRTDDRDRNDRGGRERNDRGGRERNDRGGRDGQSRRDGQRDSRGRGPGQGQRRRKGSGKDWYPPGWEGDQRGKSRKRREDDEDERKPGGRNSTQRKPRSTKGRHADRNTQRNKGARRKPKSS